MREREPRVSVHVDFEPARADWLPASADSVPVDLAEVWRSLVRGACVVAEGFFTNESWGLVLSAHGSRRAPLEGRPLNILESILCGHSQNCVSIDLGLSPATVALSARVALEQLGVKTRASRVHPLLMLAASAGRYPERIFASDTTAVRSAGSFRVIEVPRPERGLASVIPKASLDVLRRLVEGQCYTDMADGRGTSERTIANQVSAIFRRLRVSGRNELVHRLFRSSGMLPPTGAEPRVSQLAGEGRSRSCDGIASLVIGRGWSSALHVPARVVTSHPVQVLTSSTGRCEFDSESLGVECSASRQVNLR
jgi:DNA-binding NarL/FixJ family response regulator